MTREEKALIYFKDLREKKIKDYSLIFDTAPKESVVYEAVSAEIEIYDTTIKALEQKQTKTCYQMCDKWQRTGHWMDNKARTNLCNCSECGALSKAYTKYCPNCGAKME